MTPTAVAATTADHQLAGAVPTTEHPSVRPPLVNALPSCGAETIERLIGVVQQRSVRPGDHVYQQGEPVPPTLIPEGYGAARRVTASGNELVNGVAPPLHALRVVWPGGGSVEVVSQAAR